MSDKPKFEIGGKAQVWWYPPPREGEIVPDHPPVELTDAVLDVQMQPLPEDVPDWVKGILSSKGDPPPAITIGDEDAAD